MADNQVNIVITATDNASKIIGAIASGLTMVIGTVGKLTKEFIDYGDQVRTLSNFVGTNSEETSRMIQLADDAFVSFETLRMASKNLSEKGLQPSAENMAKLSDEFLKLQPGVERSNFLVDKFGRAGIEMGEIMKLGSSKIREMSASISDSLIIDDKKAAAILRTKQELDNFNDSMQGMRFEVAQRMLEIFEAMPQPMKDIVLTLGVVGESGLLGSLANMAILITSMSKAGGVGAILTSIGAGARALGAGVQAALGPVGLLIAALTALIALLNSDFGKSGIEAGKQLLAMAWGGLAGVATGGDRDRVGAAILAANNTLGLTGKATGGRVTAGGGYWVGENGPEPFIPDQSGTIIPNGAAFGGNTVVVNYKPFISTADQMQVTNILTPIIQNALRTSTGRAR